MLGLSNNAITGPLPSEILNLTKLAELRIGYNKLTGIPADGWAGLTSLTYCGL